MKKEFGHSLYSHPFTGKIHPDYDKEQIIQFLSRCPSLKKDPEFRILLDARNLVGSIPLPIDKNQTIDVVIKEFRTMGVDTLKTIFSASKAAKAWRGATALLQYQIPTPFPIAYLERKRKGTTEQGFFVSEYIEDGEEIRPLLHSLPDPEMLQLLQELASQARRWHEHGILHRDLSDGNILVRKPKDGQFELCLTDTNRIRVKKKIRSLLGVKNLIRLGIPPNFQKKFLALYTKKPQSRKSLWIWYRFNKRAYMSYIRFKKALRLKKIVRKLRLQ